MRIASLLWSCHAKCRKQPSFKPLATKAQKQKQKTTQKSVLRDAKNVPKSVSKLNCVVVTFFLSIYTFCFCFRCDNCFGCCCVRETIVKRKACKHFILHTHIYIHTNTYIFRQTLAYVRPGTFSITVFI